MKKVDKLPTIKNIKSENIHELALNILSKFSFPETSNIEDLADAYCAKYVEAYNHLISKCYVEKSPEEKEKYKKKKDADATIDKWIKNLGNK